MIMLQWPRPAPAREGIGADHPRDTFVTVEEPLNLLALQGTGHHCAAMNMVSCGMEPLDAIILLRQKLEDRGDCGMTFCPEVCQSTHGNAGESRLDWWLATKDVQPFWFGYVWFAASRVQAS